MSGLFCDTIGCSNLTIYRVPGVGGWCPTCWRGLQDLLAQKLAAGTLVENTTHWAIYCEGQRLALAARSEEATP